MNPGDQEVLHNYVQDSFQKMVRPPGGRLPYSYVIPSAPAENDSADRLKGTYLEMYDWDSYFVGLRLGVDGKADLWKNCILNFLAQTKSDGYTPRTISPTRYSDYPDQCKPFLAQGSYLASKASQDFAWITPEVYQKLASTLTYWETHRQKSDGLFVWRRAVETGADDTVTVLSAPPMTVEGVDLNCYLVKEYKAMSLIAEKLGKPGESKKYLEKSENLAAKINEKMWDKQDHLYYSLDSRTGKPIRIKDWTCFLPLWAGISSSEQAKKLVDNHLLNSKEFWGRHGIPSLAFDEETYNNAKRVLIPGYHTVSNWQGPVWIVANYLAMIGLETYQYHKQAVEIAEKIVKLVADDIRKTGGAHENYDSKTGEPLFAQNFGSWDLLADILLDEARKGHDLTALTQ
jgi:alpha,alpha-trehalase